MLTKGAKARVPDVNPIATSELDNVIRYSDARADASVTVVLAAVCATKCSVVSAVMNLA